MGMFLLVGCDRNEEESEPTDLGPIEASLGEVFEFNGLEITVGETFGFGRMSMLAYERYAGEYFFTVPVEVTNISLASHGLDFWEYMFFSPSGNQISEIGFEFIEDEIGYRGNLQPGASKSGYFHILYSGDGDYIVEFYLETSEATTLEIILTFHVEFDFAAVPIVQTQFTLGDTFEFDGFEITFGDEISWGIIDSYYWWDLNDEPYFYIPFVATNNGTEMNSLGFWLYTFNPNGSASDTYLLPSILEHEDFPLIDHVRAGDTISGHIYFLYDGDGEYVVAFSAWHAYDIEVVFDVSK